MTREHKLALIVGFSLVLLVGVLIADHLSLARRAQIAPVGDKELVVARGPVQLPVDPLLIAPSPAPQSPSSTATPPLAPPVEVAAAQPQQAPLVPQLMPEPQAAPVTEPEPRAIADAEPVSPPIGPVAPPVDPNASLRNQIQQMGGTIQGDVIKLPAQVETSKVASKETSKETKPVAPAIVKDPKAAAARTGKTLAASPETVPPVVKTHTVKKGDTLFKIAEKTYGDGDLWPLLAKFNGRSDGSVILGSTLKLPTKEALTGKPAVAPAPTAKPKEMASPAPAKPQPKKAEPPAAAPRKTELASVTYTVKKGDTLGVISQRTLGTAKRWREIAELNKLDDEDLIPAGTVLKVPPMRG